MEKEKLKNEKDAEIQRLKKEREAIKLAEKERLKQKKERLQQERESRRRELEAQILIIQANKKEREA